MKKILLVASILIATMATAFAAAALYNTPYIGNSFRKTFHYRDCGSVQQMWAEHQVPLETREEAISKGYRPCGNCRP